jgi:hypothetical protein
MNQQPILTAQRQPGLGKTILLAGLLAGTLDITSAFIYVYCLGREPIRVLYYVASGVLGKAATPGTTQIAIFGLALHYFIAFSFTILFFLIYPKLKIMAWNKYITAIVYGLFVWAVMNEVVVPLSNVTRGPFNLKGAAINAGILIIAIGLPLSLIAHAYYSKKNLAEFGSQ